MQLDVDSGPRSMAAGVGERLLHDPVRGELDDGVERERPAVQDQANRSPRGGPCLVEQLVQLCKAGLRPALGHLALGFFSQHPEQPAHLGKGGAGRVADRP